MFTDKDGSKWRPIPNSFYRTGFDLNDHEAGIKLITEALHAYDTRFMFKTVYDDDAFVHHPLVWAKVVSNGPDRAIIIAEKKCYELSQRYAKAHANMSMCEFRKDTTYDVVLYTASAFGENAEGSADAPVAFVRAEEYDAIYESLFKDIFAGDDWLDTRQYGIVHFRFSHDTLAVRGPSSFLHFDANWDSC